MCSPAFDVGGYPNRANTRFAPTKAQFHTFFSIENLLRENLTAIEEAEAIEKLRIQHEYTLADLALVLGKSDSTISDILSLNKLPDEVKNDCRNEPKAGRSILNLIARQKTPEKMTALYTKYKESGLTVGE